MEEKIAFLPPMSHLLNISAAAVEIQCFAQKHTSMADAYLTWKLESVALGQKITLPFKATQSAEQKFLFNNCSIAFMSIKTVIS